MYFNEHQGFTFHIANFPISMYIFRIISGKFRGKKINLPNDKTTRPLRDLVKEALFNVIKHSNKINIDLKDSVILDLFSGSGSFGLEAISRGAKKCLFVVLSPLNI